MYDLRPCLLFLGAALSLTAQPSTGLAGRVLDTQGRPLSGARVILQTRALAGHAFADKDGVYRREALTDKDGIWRAWLLPPGSYDVTIQADGYISKIVRGLQVAPSQFRPQVDSQDDGIVVLRAPSKQCLELEARSQSRKRQ